MTRKEALLHAIDIISNISTTHNNMLIIEKLQEIIADLPLNMWTESAIHDAIQQWAIDNGRYPMVSDFKSRYLPSHPSVKNRFGMTLGDFLAKYYPQSKPRCKTPKYRYKTKYEWKEIFINEYKRINPHSCNEFDKKRSAGVPMWITIAKMFGLCTWKELLALCGIKKGHTDFVVVQHIKVIEDLQSLKNRE